MHVRLKDCRLRRFIWGPIECYFFESCQKCVNMVSELISGLCP